MLDAAVLVQNKKIMTPILSIETILSAMMCLCSSNNNNSSYDIYSTLAEKVNYNQQKPILLTQNNEVMEMQKKLTSIEEHLAELKVQEALILAKLKKYESAAPQIRLGLKPLQQCPNNVAASPNSIYSAKLSNYADIFPILCNGNDDYGIGWMIIQRRIDGSENFFRSWQEYREGFGLLNAEFFIGLDKLHAFTSAKPHELIVLLENFEGERRFAKYDHFEVGSANEGFLLKSLGTYSGTAGDSLSHHLSQKFTTFDKDNDGATGNCAAEYTGAWWYLNCHLSNLNGRYLGGKVTEDKYAKGITWDEFGGQYYSLKSVKMMIRPTV